MSDYRNEVPRLEDDIRDNVSICVNRPIVLTLEDMEHGPIYGYVSSIPTKGDRFAIEFVFLDWADRIKFEPTPEGATE
jgi:hypothetical protein